MIGVIAGQGQMPLHLLQALRERKERTCVVSLKGVTPPLESDEQISVYPTQLGKAIKQLKKKGVTEVVFAGRLPHQLIFSLRPWHFDWTTLKLWLRLPDKRGDTILRTIANTMERAGIHVASSVKYLGRFLITPGTLTRIAPTEKQREEIRFALPLVRTLAELNIGQTLVIKRRTVVAVEAIEGTDHCLQRAFEIAGPGCIVLKGSHAKHDMRFDVPVIGRNTIEKLAKIKASLLVVEANKTLLIDLDAIELADRFQLCILAIPFHLNSA